MMAACIALAIVLLASNLFWAWQVQRLVDKVMSRNYAEYHAVNHPPAATESKIELIDPGEDMGSLQGINPFA